MQYTVTINQKWILDRGFKIDFNDAAILDFIRNRISARIDEYVADGKTFCRISYETIMEELPMLDISNVESISRRVSKLIRECLVEKHIVKGGGTFTFFRLGARYPEILFDNYLHPTQTSDRPDSNVVSDPTQTSDHIKVSSIQSQYTINYAKEHEEFQRQNPDNVSGKVSKRFMDLGWNPKETVEEFREWLTGVMKHHSTTPQVIDQVSENFFLYWSARTDKKIKNVKLTFLNSPHLPLNKKSWTKTS